jgi:hypothetical protein
LGYLEPPLESRRLFRFGGYPVTQYYILERLVHHELLESEGGSGLSCMIVDGSVVFARKNWRIIGSFYGFDHPLTGTQRYTIYTRLDPFPRMLVALGDVDRAEEWSGTRLSFYTFDVPIPDTTMYSLHHCIRSIRSTAACIPRHRVTTVSPVMPWEFRMNFYVFPAELDDCTFTDIPDVSYSLR